MCAHKEIKLSLLVNGFSLEVGYGADESCLIDRLIDRLASLYNEGKTAIAFLAGPPGSGKSTLAASIEARSAERGNNIKITSLGLDGFHLKQKALADSYTTLDGERVRLSDVKGRPETFDTDGFEKCVSLLKNREKLLWPVYDRNIHDVSELGFEPEGDVFLIEGNWLLYDDGGWARARKHADLTISLEASEEEVKRRLVERKMRGGKSFEEACLWYEKVDGPNVRLFAEKRVKADMELVLSKGALRFKEGKTFPGRA